LGIYTEYLNKGMDLNALSQERQVQLSRLSKLRGDRDVLVFASTLSKPVQQASINFTDILAFQDQLAELKGK